MAYILVVDDELASCELLVTLFTYHGHHVGTARDGAEGLAKARAGPPDLIITDILMPELDGYALATRVRAGPALAHTQVIFYTAIDLGPEVRQLAASYGVAHILIKPTEPQEILAVVQDVLASAPPVVLGTPASDLDHAYLRQLTSTLHHNLDWRKGGESNAQGLRSPVFETGAVADRLALPCGPPGRYRTCTSCVSGRRADFYATGGGVARWHGSEAALLILSSLVGATGFEPVSEAYKASALTIVLRAGGLWSRQ